MSNCMMCGAECPYSNFCDVCWGNSSSGLNVDISMDYEAPNFFGVNCPHDGVNFMCEHVHTYHSAFEMDSVEYIEERDLPHRILHLPMDPNDAADTVGEYFGELLSALWIEGECFSGKRPLGNSDWQYVIYAAMVRGGIIEGSFDEDGYLDDFDRETGDELILEAIELLTDHGND